MIQSHSDHQQTFDVYDGEVNLSYDENDYLQNLETPKKLNINNSTTNQTENISDIPLNRRISSNQIHLTQCQWIVGDRLDQKYQMSNGIVENLYQEESIVEQFLPQYHQNDCPIELQETLQNNSFSNNIITIQILEQQQPKHQENEKNDSKNVPKGMMKAFAHMILDKNLQNVKVLRSYFEKSGQDFEKYKDRMRKVRKSSKISISQIRDMLMKDDFARSMRVLGNYFIRRRFLGHIFNSKMQKRHIHMKYIYKWLQIFKNPIEFTSLK